MVGKHLTEVLAVPLEGLPFVASLVTVFGRVRRRLAHREVNQHCLIPELVPCAAVELVLIRKVSYNVFACEYAGTVRERLTMTKLKLYLYGRPKYLNL